MKLLNEINIKIRRNKNNKSTEQDIDSKVTFITMSITRNNVSWILCLKYCFINYEISVLQTIST